MATPPIGKTEIGEEVTARIPNRLQIDTKKYTPKTLMPQRYSEKLPSTNRTAVGEYRILFYIVFPFVARWTRLCI